MGQLCEKCKLKKPDVKPADDVKYGKRDALLCNECWARCKRDTQLKPET